MAKSSVLVLGAGKVGKSVAELLLACGQGQYRVTVADRDKKTLDGVGEQLSRLPARGKAAFDTLRLDVGKKKAVRAALEAHDYVICMLPFHFVAGIAEAANDVGAHYFDVTEDVATTDRVRRIEAEGRARVALVPQCGLAPGYIAIAAYDVARRFDAVHELTLRVGALPQFPTNSLHYNLTWSTEGVINEYCEACNVMQHGAFVKVPALEGLEGFSFEGIEYEAFYTSGGVGSLIETLVADGKTSGETNIAYKTIRYPGHCERMRFLLQELRLGAEPPERVPEAERATRWTHATYNRKLLENLFDHAVPRTLQDVVVVFISGIGERGGRRMQINLKKAIHATSMFGRVWPAIELTTASGVCAMVDLHRTGKLPRKTGFIRQEECPLDQFEGTLFGSAYTEPEKMEARAGGR